MFGKTSFASGIDEGGMMNDENVQVQGSPWTNERYLATYEEATFLRDSLNARDHSGTLEIKIKRCGEGGRLYVVKSRQSHELKQAEDQLDSDLETVQATKKTRKAKK